MSQILLERLFYALVILQNSIRVDICKIFFVCLVAVAFSTLAYIFVDSLFNLSFDKEADIVVQISHLRNRSSLLIKIVFYIQITKNKIIMQSTSLFRAIFQSLYKYLA